MNKIDRIISIIRSLREEGIPTMNTATTAGKAGFGGSAQGFDPGPTAGYDSPLDGRTKMAKRLPPEYRKKLSKKERKNK
jgi:hypothetical protein